MRSPRPEHPVPPPPPYAPTSGGADAALAAALGAAPGGGDPADTYPATVLLARHCRAMSDYAALLTTSRTYASMAVSAAFARVLDELRYGGGSGTEAAVRPRLLAAVRRTVADWARDPRTAALLTGLPDPAAPGPDRLLVARAFAALPGPAQVLLWHREVEAEGISIPAALLAVDPRTASAQLDDARELFRDGCLRVHSELATDPECRHYNRLLDISLRRGGELIPDIRRHLSKCRHCRYAADQLDHSGGRLPLLLAEGVLGEGARGYVESRPGRSRARTAAPAEAPRRAGRHSRAVPAGAARRLAAAVPGGGTLLVGLGVVMAGVLGVAAVTSLWPDRDGGGRSAGPAAPGGSGGAAAPAPGSRPTTATPRPPAPAGHGGGAPTTRLRNARAAELCLDIRDGRPQVGAELMLAVCSGHPAQTWRYEPDGLLRSAAAPDLCAHSQEPSGVVVLRLCATQAAMTVRYDLSVQGDLVPRWHAGLGLVPTAPQAGATVVVRMRDGSASQRWLTDNAVGAPATVPAPRRAVDDIDATGGGATGRTRAPGAPTGPSADRPAAPPAATGGRTAATGAPSGGRDGERSQEQDGEPYGERDGVRGVSAPAPDPGARPEAPDPGAPSGAPGRAVELAPAEGAGPLVLTVVPGAAAPAVDRGGAVTD
ncbi:ricin-type beta-trefoil lectin domain protein [Streptomyces sp. NPDC016309]|uniref:ricin-type beta-trefoil lectin domain protein n=1 Tax=Streptomyces sp. NPDC016309 TaxID=3364965 RepID=UPI0036F912EE